MNKNNIEYLETFKYIFVVPTQNFSVAIESEDKTGAIKIFMEEYPKLFELDFNIIKLSREISNSKEKIFL